MQPQAFPRYLADGLLLRQATAADAQTLADFNAWIHGDIERNFRSEGIGVWTQDLLTKPHPTFQPGDFTIVEDTTTGKIVSSLNLINQTWAYEEVNFAVGRPELVGTHPDYRNRGLVRAQFELLHQWSAARGQMLQAITGIPYYYRLFGYEMALNLGGGRAGYTPHIPKLKEGQAEPFFIRPAGQADLPLISELYDLGARRSLVRCVWTPELWQYELTGKSEANINRVELQIIETPTGEAVGFIAHHSLRWGSMMSLQIYELKPGISWGAVTPSVIRYLAATGSARKPYHGDEPLGSFGFWLGEEHPVYTVAAEHMPRIRKPYAWYLRLPDLPGFIRQITPVLERRLARSPLNGYEGEFKITFYQQGLHLKFAQGCLTAVGSYQPHLVGGVGDAGFPGLTFLQLVFGYRSLDELKHAFPDCWTEDDTGDALLKILFPKQASDIWAVS